MTKRITSLPRVGYTIREVAQQLGMRYDTVRVMCRHDMIPCARLGRTYVIPASWLLDMDAGVVQQWIDAHGAPEDSGE